jgi:hypothetical protein
VAADVRPIRELKRDCDPKVIEILEKLLVEAKAGEVTGFAYVLETPTTFDVGHHGALFNLLALVERLKHRINVAIDER